VIIMNALAIGVGIAAIGTLFLMRIPFCGLEKFLYYMVLVTVQEHAHSMLPLNDKLFEITKSAAAFTFFKTNQLLIWPIAGMWLLYAFFHPRVHAGFKLLLLAGWLWGVHGTYLGMRRLEVIRFSGWNWPYSASMWFGVLLVAFAFSLWFRRLLRKRDRDAAMA